MEYRQRMWTEIFKDRTTGAFVFAIIEGFEPSDLIQATKEWNLLNKMKPPADDASDEEWLEFQEMLSIEKDNRHTRQEEIKNVLAVQRHVSQLKCYNCGKKGHKKNECLQPPKSKKHGKTIGVASPPAICIH